jgi:hypothetical protein
MLDLGRTSFVMLLEAAKAFSIPVVKRTMMITSNDVSGNSIKTVGLFTVPLPISYCNHCSDDENDPAFEIIKTSGDYDTLLPA